MALRIAIEGNISAGKSTLLSLLSKQLDFLVVPEPLDKWQSIDNSVEEEGEETGIQSESQESGMNLLVCVSYLKYLNCKGEFEFFFLTSGLLLSRSEAMGLHIPDVRFPIKNPSSVEAVRRIPGI